jgi:hypothetical protein
VSGYRESYGHIGKRSTQDEFFKHIKTFEFLSMLKLCLYLFFPFCLTGGKVSFPKQIKHFQLCFAKLKMLCISTFSMKFFSVHIEFCACLQVVQAKFLTLTSFFLHYALVLTAV